jgi:hypothetical protein
VTLQGDPCTQDVRADGPDLEGREVVSDEQSQPDLTRLALRRGDLEALVAPDPQRPSVFEPMGFLDGQDPHVLAPQ